MKLHTLITNIHTKPNPEYHKQVLIDFLKEHIRDPEYLRHEIVDAMHKGEHFEQIYQSK